MKLQLKPISLKYFYFIYIQIWGNSRPENKYAQKLVFDHCAKINTREINRSPMREIKSARKLVRIRYYYSKKQMQATLNPLSANVGYIRHDTVVTSDSCNSEHSQNCIKILTSSYKNLKFSTKWYTKLCILFDPFLRNCVTKSNFRYLKKKAQKSCGNSKDVRFFLVLLVFWKFWPVQFWQTSCTS